MNKILLALGIGLLALIAVIAITLGLYMGPIVKAGVQGVGPKMIQVPITMDDVYISLLTGSAQVKGLIVGNPQGYKTPQAISVGLVSVSVAPFSVLSNKIVVRSVQVKSAQITFEGGLSGNNLSRIMDNVNAFSKKALPASSQSNNKPAPKIEVDDFLITGAKVDVHIASFGSSRAMTIPLPDIHLTDLGKDSNGLTPAELTKAILNSIISETIKAVSGSVTVVVQGMKGVGKTVAGSVGEISNSISALFKQ